MMWWSRRSDRRNERTRHIAIASLVGFVGLTTSAFLGHSPILSVIAITHRLDQDGHRQLHLGPGRGRAWRIINRSDRPADW
jgi:hypothetical protein